SRAALLGLGSSGIFPDYRHDGAGPRDSVGFHGGYAAHRRPSAHEPVRLRHWPALLALSHPSLAPAPTPAGGDISGADRRPPGRLHKAADRNAGRFGGDPSGTSVRKWPGAERALPARSAEPNGKFRPSNHSRAPLFRARRQSRRLLG